MAKKKIIIEWYEPDYADFRKFVNEQPAEVLREAFLAFFDMVYGHGEGTKEDPNMVIGPPSNSFLENPQFSEDVAETVRNISRSFQKKD